MGTGSFLGGYSGWGVALTSAEVKKVKVQIYLYSSFGTSWQVIG